MSARLAIHQQPGTFSDRWIKYCSENGISFKIVNCYDTDIMQQLRDVQGLLFHWIFHEPVARLSARQIIASAEMMGIEVFPNIATCWHYDDKLAQKYLLESVEAPLIRSYVFYDKRDALEWIGKTEFPKVFKLRCGAGSSNVKLIKSSKEAMATCERAFGRGFNPFGGYLSDTRVKLRRINNLSDMIERLGRFPQSFRLIASRNKMLAREKGYAYFQDFLPNNNYDTRITVIGKRAFGFTRNVRPNDFRASGSGDFSFDTEMIDIKCIEIAFKMARKLQSQSMAFDFLKDPYGNLKICEISYAFISNVLHDCPGHWDEQLTWHHGKIYPEDAILRDILENCGRKNSNQRVL